MIPVLYENIKDFRFMYVIYIDHRIIDNIMI